MNVVTRNVNPSRDCEYEEFYVLHLLVAFSCTREDNYKVSQICLTA